MDGQGISYVTNAVSSEIGTGAVEEVLGALFQECNLSACSNVKFLSHHFVAAAFLVEESVVHGTLHKLVHIDRAVAAILVAGVVVPADEGVEDQGVEHGVDSDAWLPLEQRDGNVLLRGEGDFRESRQSP